MDKEKCIAVLETGSLDSVLEFLQSEEKFKIFSDCVINIRTTYASTDLPTVAWSCLGEATRVGSKKAADNLENFIQGKEFALIDVLAIRGITISEPIYISSNIELIPFSAIPDSFKKALYDPSSLSEEFINPYVLFRELVKPDWAYVQEHIYKTIKPTAALIYHQSVGPRFLSEDSEELDFKPPDKNLNDLQDACRCLTLIGPCSPTPLAFWWQTEHWIPHFESSAEPCFFRESDLINDTIHPLASNEIEEDAKKLFKQFSSFPDKEKKILRIAIDRLNRSISRKNYEDTAIELGIAIEAIFLNVGGNNGELSFQASLRAAWLLGNNNVERNQIQKLFKKIYQYRSDAVHTGAIKIKNDTVQNIQSGHRYVAHAIRAIILDNKWPDWDTLIFGGVRE